MAVLPWQWRALLLWLGLVLPWCQRFLHVEEYMDEIFHGPQTRRYCEGKMTEWDPAITTLPGLYIFGAAFSKTLARLAPAALAEECSKDSLRAANVLFGAGCLLLLHRLLRRRMGDAKAALHALVLSLYPIHFFYTFLYYTDVGSLFWVLLTHHLVAPSPGRALPGAGRIACAALAGSVAVLFRQTNAVWLLFTFGTVLLADVQASKRWGARLGRAGLGGATGEAAEEPSLPVLLLTFVEALLRELPRLLLRFGALLVPVVLFIAFVVWNGSIVVGHQEHHQMVAHWGQLAYLSLVTASLWGFAFPAVVSDGASPLAFCRVCVRDWKSLALAVLTTAGFALVLSRYCLSHPFLLADNRHYTFYVWNRILGKYPQLRPALAPLCTYAAWFCHRRMSGAQSQLWMVIWYVAAALTLVPAHLLEPRYWTTAVVLVHVHSPEQPWWSLLLVGAAFLAVNMATLYVFVHKPFLWPSGDVARFMW